MNDNEIVKACAEAMGLHLSQDIRAKDWTYLYGEWPSTRYDPLHDDAQAMALVRKFGMNITGPSIDDGSTKPWCAWLPKWVRHGSIIEADDLNRAICLCVAQLHGGRNG